MGLNVEAKLRAVVIFEYFELLSSNCNCALDEARYSFCQSGIKRHTKSDHLSINLSATFINRKKLLKLINVLDPRSELINLTMDYSIYFSTSVTSLSWNSCDTVQSFFLTMRVLIVKSLCGFTQLLNGRVPFSKEFMRIPFCDTLLVMRQQIRSSLALSLLLEIISAGLSFCPVKSVYGNGMRTISR